MALHNLRHPSSLHNHLCRPFLLSFDSTPWHTIWYNHHHPGVSQTSVTMPRSRHVLNQLGLHLYSWVFRGGGGSSCPPSIKTPCHLFMLPTMHYRVPSKALEKAVHSFMFPPDARITPHLSLSVHTILQLHIFSSIACQMFQGVLHGANTLLSLPLTLVSNLILPELDCLFLAPHRSMPSSWLMPFPYFPFEPWMSLGMTFLPWHFTTDHIHTTSLPPHYSPFPIVAPTTPGLHAECVINAARITFFSESSSCDVVPNHIFTLMMPLHFNISRVLHLTPQVIKGHPSSWRPSSSWPQASVITSQLMVRATKKTKASSVASQSPLANLMPS